MSNRDEMRKFMNILTESKGGQVDPDVAEKLLTKLSPTYRKAKKQDKVVDEEIGTMIAGTIAFVAILIGGVEVTQVGPFDVAGAQEMSRVIERDVQRSYDEWHPHGWTDGSGTIYRMSDWEFEIQTMHSSEYLERQRQENQ
jgi:hypothetical protein